MSDAQHDEEERYNDTFHNEEEEEDEAGGGRLMLSQQFDSNDNVVSWLQSACERIARKHTAYFPNSYHQQCLDFRIRYLQGNSTVHSIPKPPPPTNNDSNFAQALFTACNQYLLPGVESIQISPSSSTSISVNSSVPQTSRELGAMQFVSGFLKNSRLSFLGSWKRRYESLLDEVPISPLINFSIPRVLLHVDLDAFFCSASLLNKSQDLKQQPVAVCWCTSSGSSSEISSCNYLARASGVRAGMPLKNARELCSALVALPFDFALYEELSLDFYKTMFAFSPHVEGVSCDEAFMDVTHLMQQYGDDVVQVANELRANIFKATNGLTASVGCGKNKMMARLCTGKAKPNGVFSSIGVDIEEILNHNLSVSALHSIGRSTVATLKEAFQCEFVAQLRSIPLVDLQSKFGPVAGKRLFQLSRGEDDSRWTPRPERDSMSVQISWGVRMETEKQVVEFFRELCEQLIKRLDGKFGDSVNVKVWRAVKNQPDYMRKGKIGHGICDVLTKTQRNTAARTVDSLLHCVLELFHKMDTSAEDIRGLGVSVSGLIKTSKNARDGSGCGIAVWLDPKRQHVDCFQRLWDLGETRNAIDKELAFAFEVASRCPLWPDCAQATTCCGEANRLAIRCGVIPLLRGLIACKPQEKQNILHFTRFTALQNYSALPSSHALSRFALVGGGTVYLNEALTDLE